MTRHRFSAGIATLLALALAAGLILLTDREGRADAALEEFDSGAEIVTVSEAPLRRPVRSSGTLELEGYLWSGRRMMPESSLSGNGALALDGYVWGAGSRLPERWSAN